MCSRNHGRIDLILFTIPCSQFVQLNYDCGTQKQWDTLKLCDQFAEANKRRLKQKQTICHHVQPFSPLLWTRSGTSSFQAVRALEWQISLLLSCFYIVNMLNLQYWQAHDPNNNHSLGDIGHVRLPWSCSKASRYDQMWYKWLKQAVEISLVVR